MSRRLLGIVVALAALALAGVTLAAVTRSDPAPDPRRRADAISVADVTGLDTVALTIAPPRPGPVRLRVDIVGVNEARANHLLVRSASGTIDGGSTTLHPCGTGCFEGSLTLHGAPGSWTFAVGGRFGTAPFTTHYTVPLPATSGRVEFDAMLARMRTLHSVRVRETFRTRVGGPVTDTVYRYQAPNRLAYDQHGATHAGVVAIGTRRYQRLSPSAAWKSDTWPAPGGFVWPADFYDEFWTPAIAVQQLGPAVLRGEPTHVIAFARADTDAWFRLWIGDRDGLVHRMEMRARSHIMNQDYDRFDQPLGVVAPR